MLLSARSGNACPGVRSLVTTWLTASAIAIASAAPLSAQDSRADEIAAKQKEKAGNLSTYKPNKAEAFLLALEENFASPPNGFYPEFSSIYQGGGFTLGAGYRRFFARDAVWNLRGLYSVKNYKQVEIGARTPWFTNGRWTVDARVGWLDAPQVAYYGLGMTDGATRANTTLQQTYATALAEVRPSRWSRLIGELGRRLPHKAGQRQRAVDRNHLQREQHTGAARRSGVPPHRGDGRDRLAARGRLRAQGRLLRRHADELR